MKLICDCGRVILEGPISVGATMLHIDWVRGSEPTDALTCACGRIILSVREVARDGGEETDESDSPHLEIVPWPPS